MKILFTNTGSWGTGSFVVVDAVAGMLEEMGHEVKIFFPDNGLETKDKHKYYYNKRYEIWQFPIKKNDVEIEAFPLMIPDPDPRATQYSLTYKNLSKEQLDLFAEVFSEEIEKVIDKFRPDIIDSQHIWFMAYVLQKLKHQYIVSAHNSDQVAFKYDKSMQRRAITAAQSAQSIFALTEELKQQIIKLYGVTADKIFVLPNGYDEKTFKPMQVNRAAVLEKLNLKIPDDATIVTFVGKMSKIKGIDVLLHANKLLSAKDNIHFLLFGAGNIDDVILPNQRDKCCFDRMHFLGHQLPEVLAQASNIAKFNVMPSRTEGFAISCLEAMGCGLPVVFTKCGGMEKFAVGEMMDVDNVQQFVDAVKKLARMPENEYKVLSKAAIAKAKEFSWKGITQQRLKYYEQIVSGKK